MATIAEINAGLRVFDALSRACRSATRSLHRFHVAMRRQQLRVDLERPHTLPPPLIWLLVRWCPERWLPEYVTFLEG